MSATVDRLEALGLLRPGAPTADKRLKRARPERALLLLCDAGALDGGLSVALDVRPDELIGPLCAAAGGSARSLKVLDVRDLPELELRIAYGDLSEGWAVPDARALVHNLNDLLGADPAARAIAVLGEWQDSLQLWCVPKEKLGALFRESFFEPANRDELRLLIEGE